MLSHDLAIAVAQSRYMVRSFAAFTLVLAKCILASYPTALVVVMLDARTRTDLGVGNFPILPLGSV
ncbi:MAG: hypothetical protein C4295_02980 [Candidatus Fervidibacterota bacterium]